MKPMTVLARIRHGQEPALREVLTEINADMSGNPYWRLPESQLTHFARLVIVSEPADDQRLLFSSDHDGTLEEYIAEMVRISPGLERIWSTCEGYDRNEDFTWFIRRNLQRGQDSFA